MSGYDELFEPMRMTWAACIIMRAKYDPTFPNTMLLKLTGDEIDLLYDGDDEEQD
jgi:hypothetical protein